MKSRIIVIFCFLFSVVPVFSFAQVKKLPDSNVSAYEHTYENMKSEHAEYLLYKKEKKEAMLAEWRAKKANQVKKEAEEAQDKISRELKENDSGSNMSVYERVRENAKFKRSKDQFNSKTDKKIRTEKKAEKKAAEAVETKKKTEEAQDKGEGQFKVKF